MVGTATEIVVPEIGQVVRCRDRIWAVNEVSPSTLSEDVVAGIRPHHLVHLASLEDDGFGDELSVLWELEPGTQVIPHQELPRPVLDALDPPERLDAFLDAVRWGTVATADSKALQAPFRSGITIEDYQLDPVVRALSMPRVNLLIADDELGSILRRALERAGLCSSDPLCADHHPDAATGALHGAACHACLLVAETSCERGNRYLDRATLVETFRHVGMEYFT